MDDKDFICCECLKNIDINDGNIESKLCYPCMTEIIKHSIPVINCQKCKKEFGQENDNIILCNECYDKKNN
jgi:hypothetical protein